MSPGIAEGSVRLVRDGSGELNPGEILVCETTDPSYAAYFLVAEGVITDIGGAMGHGAIVRARGWHSLRGEHACRDAAPADTGDRVRIDGTSGSIEVLSTAGDASERNESEGRP